MDDEYSETSYHTPSYHDDSDYENECVEASQYEIETNVNEVKKYYESKIDAQYKKLLKIDAKQVNDKENARIYQNIIDLRKEMESEIEFIQNTKTRVDENTENNVDDVNTYKTLHIPSVIFEYLFLHQKTGVKWMLDLYLKKKGGILADEMGLGKSVMVLAFIFTLVHSNTNCKRFLILCPATVVHVWKDEFHKMCELVDENIAIEFDFVDRNTSTNKNSILYVLSYSTFLSKNSECVDCEFKEDINSERMKYDCVFLDEGHKIKNKDTKIAKVCKNITSKVNFIVSGTPIQNNLLELWSVMDFVAKNVLGMADDFERDFIAPIVNKTNSELSYQISNDLKMIVEPFLLRRTKNDIVHDLPSKTDKVLFCSLTNEQTQLYYQAIEKYNTVRTRMTSETILKIIDHMRKICNHTFLIKEPEQYIEEDMSDCAHNSNRFLEGSCKMKAMWKKMVQWLEENERGKNNKVLIFTQTVQIQKIINRFFEDLNCFDWLVLNGKVPQKERKFLIEQFNKRDDIFAFLLTTKTGGLGINLTGANKIIIYDPDWNPSTDAQAKERIYRYGQTRDVEIFRLVCRGTVEEKIYQKQIYKECLSKRIFKNPKAFLQKDAIDLFTYGKPLVKEDEEMLDKNYKK